MFPRWPGDVPRSNYRSLFASTGLSSAARRAQVAVAPVSTRHAVPIALRDCEESGTARPRKDKAKRKPFAQYDGP